MNVLVTGAAGFLRRRLIHTNLSDTNAPPAVTHIVAADVASRAVSDSRVESRVGSIANNDFVSAIVRDDVDVVYHLAAVLSGQSEAEFDVGMRVNVDGTRNLLDACRRRPRPRRFVFTSTLAVY